MKLGQLRTEGGGKIAFPPLQFHIIILIKLSFKLLFPNLKVELWKMYILLFKFLFFLITVELMFSEGHLSSCERNK